MIRPFPKRHATYPRFGLFWGATTFASALPMVEAASAPSTILAGSVEVTGPFFGQKLPGKTPERFAPGILSLPNRLVTRIAFSPDGNECFFSAPNDDFSHVQMYCMKRVDDVWTSRFLAPFLRPGHSGRQAIFSADGNQLHFSSNENGNSDLWVVEHASQGWGDPHALPAPINTPAYEGQYSQAADGIAYFESDRPGGQGKFDIWRARPPQPGQPPQVENLGALVNSVAGDSDPFVSPDGSYLLFSSERPGGVGQSDVYVTLADGHGGWSAPVNLNHYGPGLNTGVYTYAPALSADGRILFFTRIGEDAQQNGIYWVENPLGPGTSGAPQASSERNSTSR
jgi:WD40-like Beta Propeller Repeat